MLIKSQPYFDADKDAGGTTGDDGAGKQKDAPQSFEGWLDTQDEPIINLYQEHIKGLKNTVSATRQERDDLAKQLKDLAGKADKGSEMEKALNENIQKLEIAERRARFIEDAIKPEIGCRNPKAAWLLANADGLFDRKGSPDWAAIKDAAPEIFGKPNASGNAGTGTEKPPNKNDMNTFIRAAAGRG